MAATEHGTRSAEEVARGYFEAIGRRDAEAAVAHWHPDGIDDVAPIGVLRGQEEIRRFLTDLVAAMPDLEMVVSRITADERVAAAEWRLSGTFTGVPFQGIDPTGSTVELRGVDLVEVEDGRIVRNTAYYDGAEFARQVGMLPRRDSGTEKALTAAFNGATRLRALVREQLDR